MGSAFFAPLFMNCGQGGWGGGGGEYVRKLARGLADSCESRVFYAARGECGAAVVNAWKPDVIHVNHLRALLQLFKFPWKRPVAPVVLTVHGIHLRKYGFLPRTLKNRLLRFIRLGDALESRVRSEYSLTRMLAATASLYAFLVTARIHRC